MQTTQANAALIALDKLDKIGADGVKKEFAARGVNEAAGDRLLNFFSTLVSLEHAAEIVAEEQSRQALNKAVLGRIVEFVNDNELGAQGVAELQSILDYVDAMGLSDRIKIDPSLARGLRGKNSVFQTVFSSRFPGWTGCP